MKPSISSWVFSLFLFPALFLYSPIYCSSSSLLPPLTASSIDGLQNYTAMSIFRALNRRVLKQCSNLNPYLRVSVSKNSSLADEEYVTVTVSGVLIPAVSDWVAMTFHDFIYNYFSKTKKLNAIEIKWQSACPSSVFYYAQTGDLSRLPLLCHYPVKAQYMKNDPGYLKCQQKECRRSSRGTCLVRTCSGSVTFHVVNIRTDIEFVFFAGGFETPCVLARSQPLSFANPNMPLYGHLSSIDSTGTSMRLTWVSGDKEPQQVQYEGKSQVSEVATFTQDDMCGFAEISPAKDFGWHDPGFIHSAVMTRLEPSRKFSYRYGSDAAGWSNLTQFQTPPAGGSDELRFIAFGDMGKAPRDNSTEHYIQPGSISVIEAIGREVSSDNVDSIFHIGDISYATGFLVEWDYFLHLINPVASQVPYMTAIGNHEMDYPDSASLFITPDSGGECGVPYWTHFPMPTVEKVKPWYSIEQGSVHFTIISTEHDWDEGSEQYEWMKADMGSVNRSRTPWLIFMGHRQMYSSGSSLPGLHFNLTSAVEPLLVNYKVDLAMFGHVHNYERTCAVYNNDCKGMPQKDASGTDVYDNSNYTAPVQAVIGMAGFSLDKFPKTVENKWSLARISEHGYVRGHATREELKMEFVESKTGKVGDSFRIIRNPTR